MTKISKILTAAAALGVMGLAVLPAAGYAATKDAEVQVVIGGADSIDGGNNGAGYVWLISDKNGAATDTTNLALGNSGGAASGGFALISSRVPVTTGMTTANTYGFKVTFTESTGVVNSGEVHTDGSGLQFYGADILTSNQSVTNASTPVAVGTSAAGTVTVDIPALTGSAGGGAGSAFQYDTSLAAGTYSNTFLITCLPK